MKTYAVVQHTYAEFLGTIEKHLEKRDIGFSYFRPFVGQDLPGNAALFDALFLLGGGRPPVGEEAYDWLDDEQRLIAAFEKADRPVVGFGLGAQLIAAVHGAELAEEPIHTGYWTTAHKTDVGAGDELAERVDGRRVLVMCNGRADLPASLQPTLVDDAGHWLAVRPRPTTYALLFRPEVKPGMIEDMIMEADRDLPDNIDQLLGETRQEWQAMQETTDQVLVALVKELNLMQERRKPPVFNLKVAE